MSSVIFDLRHIFIRALHPSPFPNAGGPRTAQPPSARFPRTSTSGISPRPRSSRPLPASTIRPPAARQPNSRGPTPPTTSRRLAQLDIPPHQRPRPRPGGPALIISPRETRTSRYPPSKPFSPKTYDSPGASADTHSAAPKPFDDFELHPVLFEPVKERFGPKGKTTAIQTLSLRYFLPSFDEPARALLGAETGSGKTFAYLLPLFSHLKSTDDRGPIPEEAKTLNPRALVLSPTHELTRQSTGMAKTLCHTVKLSVMGMSSTKYGGIGERRGGVDVLFGTGAMTRRMLGLASPQAEVKDEEDARKAYIGVDRLDWVVIDEADVLLGAHRATCEI